MNPIRKCDLCNDYIQKTAHKIGMRTYCKECALQARRRIFQVKCAGCGKELISKNKCIAYLYAGDYYCKDCFLDCSEIKD